MITTAVSNKNKRAADSTCSSDCPTKTQKLFKHGNYNRYYGYRNENNSTDERTTLLHRNWFKSKVCLDVGCNVGHLTLWIAKHFAPTKITGVDIDVNLIKAARANVLHYIHNDDSDNTRIESNNTQHLLAKKTNVSEDIGSLSVQQRPQRSNNSLPNIGCDQDDATSTSLACFPLNVSFITENYVPASDNVLKYTREEYDVVICFSVTKWIQLNTGDQGVKRMFKKVFKQLKPAGRFILEPQPFSSYKRRKNLTSEIRKNYDSMRFMPEDYVEYLLSAEVGFKSCEQLDLLKHNKQGFQRPVYLLMKS